MSADIYRQQAQTDLTFQIKLQNHCCHFEICSGKSASHIMATARQGSVQSLACGVAKIAVLTSQVGNEQWEGPARVRSSKTTPESSSASSTPATATKKRFGFFSSKSKSPDRLVPSGSDPSSPKDSRKYSHEIRRSRSHQAKLHRATAIEVSVNVCMCACMYVCMYVCE